MKPVYVTEYARSAFTRAHPSKPGVDAFEGTRADSLLAQLIDHTLERAPYDGADVEELAIGCALPVNDQWNFGGRYPVFLSGLADSCASRTIEQQCGSGLAAIRSAALSVASGAADIVMAGGYENMTRVPMGPALFEAGTLTVPDLPADAYDARVVMNMGLTAEALAEKGAISRAAMDAFACASHQKASAAEDDGFFDGERISLQTADGDAVAKDACIRPDTDPERLASLRSVFKEDGVISAGNSSPLTSGAAVMTLMSEEAVKRTGATPRARILACVDRGTKPELMGQGVVPACEKALALAGLGVDDIDAWEINEAFSAVPLYAAKALGIDEDRINRRGGALALGHPLGATGIRLAGTLMRILEAEGGRYGCATACIGGGQGIALVLERVAA
ncbi:acetyl-CoA C-acyltransferase [Kordiimonas marina]|uniref:acetyl-CoA C-acyltransferase n=1 Tax=Kordiimonas marina TaxID=2872312 RepID=UPI001FF1F3A3|nr:acetyl-CoA C-acyltransferase [Kordiimonas marina]MCJ9430080.1 acetyl-CoA C-acyltransferase [Kordiimonas marina]